MFLPRFTIYIEAGTLLLPHRSDVNDFAGSESIVKIREYVNPRAEQKNILERERLLMNNKELRDFR